MKINYESWGLSILLKGYIYIGVVQHTLALSWLIVEKLVLVLLTSYYRKQLPLFIGKLNLYNFHKTKSAFSLSKGG